jgi:hypothetical protein
LNKEGEGDSLDLGNGWLRCIVKCDSLLEKGLQSKEDSDINNFSIIIVLALCLAFIGVPFIDTPAGPIAAVGRFTLDAA